MIELEVLDRLLALVTGVVAVGFSLGALLVIGAALGSVAWLRRSSQSPSITSGKGSL